MVVTCTKVNATVIKWCRDEGGYSEKETAKRLKVEESAYKLLESGEAKPTLGQLRALADYFKRPLAVFFLPKPPENLKKPEDYRAHKGTLSTATLRSIRRARFVQKNYATIENVKPVQVWTSVSDTVQNANNARGWLGLTDELQTKNRDINGFYRYLIDLLEHKSISVLQHSFPYADAKAYSFAETPAVVVVPTSDPYVGSRIFSILHELCHISHGQSGLCITNETSQSYAKERQCDRFATEFLMPRRLVKQLANGLGADQLLDTDYLKATAERLKCSMLALLIRLKEMGYIDQPQLNKKKAEWGKIPHRKNGFAITTRAQRTVKINGVPFTEAVVKAYNADRITANDASYMLDINQSYINEVGEKIGVS